MLSPMAGFTDAPMRLISGRFGAARTFTEMVNAAGLARDGEASWALLEEAEAAGASSFAVHGRYRAQGHAGPVAFDVVAEVKRRASIPIYGNGGVRDAATAADFIARTGVDGLLVGQGAIGHPWVFREIRDGVSFPQGLSRATAIPLDEIRAVLLEHLDLDFAFITDLAAKYPTLLTDDTPEMLTVIRFRMHLFRYLSGLKGVSHMRGRLSTVRTLDEVRRAIDDCLACEAARRARRAERLASGGEVASAAGEQGDAADV